MNEEAEVRWGRLQVGQTIKFWSYVCAQEVEAEIEGARIKISLHQSLWDEDRIPDFYLEAVIESMNAVLYGFGLRLRHRGEFFVNREGAEEELTEDHPFVQTMLASFWGDEDEWSKSWGDLALARDVIDNRLENNKLLFEPYISYIVEEI